MYNSDIPTRADLPTSKQLLRSTVIAILAAAAILVTIVLPAEYGIDPTGIGRTIGLAEMGEIKKQLAEEAEQDHGAADRKSSLIERIFAAVWIKPAAAQTAPTGRSDEMTITLKPGEGSEIKLAMKKGSKVNYAWTASGGVVNYDMHGDAGGQETSYEKGRAKSGAEGVLEAGADGNHGWFWRNRDKTDVTVTLRTSGAYADIKRMK
ncbi:MAG: transmembrane anchor protein [Alphaproteobacteria bacterium]|nr:transmembrane anchor protein [Alphaproteobacteria bacterium]